MKMLLWFYGCVCMAISNNALIIYIFLLDWYIETFQCLVKVIADVQVKYVEHNINVELKLLCSS